MREPLEKRVRVPVMILSRKLGKVDRAMGFR